MKKKSKEVIVILVCALLALSVLSFEKTANYFEDNSTTYSNLPGKSDSTPDNTPPIVLR